MPTGKETPKIADDLVYVLRRRRANRRNDQFSVIGVFTSEEEIQWYIKEDLDNDRPDKYNWKRYALNKGSYI